MLHLVSFSCYMCDYNYTRFFNSTDRRPCFGVCNHSACTFCVDKHPDMACRICGQKNAFKSRTVNYVAESVIEDYRKTCIDVYRSWWRGKESGKGTCPVCIEPNRILRLCKKCRESNFVYSVNETPTLFLNSPTDIYKFSSILKCADCVCNKCEHGNENIIKLTTLDNFEYEIKRATLNIVAELLYEQLQISNGTCKLRYLQMLRTCEVLINLSRCRYKEEMPEQLKLIWIDDTYVSMSSRSCKFFIGLNCSPEIEGNVNLVERLLDSLDFQWAEYKSTVGSSCRCTKIWDELVENGYGNEIELQFAKIVMNVRIDDPLKGCLLEFETSDKERRRIEELRQFFEQSYPFKTHLLPSVYCWNKYRGGHCDLFNSTDRKPCICRKCKNSICLKCVQSNFGIKCPFCEAEYNPINWMQRPNKKQLKKLPRTYNHSSKIIELVDFYKTNCVNVYEEWWKGKAVGEGFCMGCFSYSKQLEVCIHCELDYSEGVLKRDADDDFKLAFFAPPSNTPNQRFATRWQCSGCLPRLKSNLELENSVRFENFDNHLEMFRGCNFKTRLSNGCWKFDKKEEPPFTLSIVKLKDIKNSEYITKWSTMDVANRILEAGLKEHQNKQELMRIQRDLSEKTEIYFRRVLVLVLAGDERGEELELELVREINELIENLKVNVCT
uniref:RING-type domain-containing protein n=1 Tax=Caenorhabditis japonica TaxID=281687 RepID=A0A8R1E133_CAEJA